jgi:hypothetical protein
VLFSTLARILRLASTVICLIALASFVTFAVDQAGKGSSHQQAEVNEAAPAGTVTTDTNTSGESKKSGLHEAIDKAFSTLSSPFSGITSGSTSQWTIQIVDTLLVLLVYGFGLSFIARLLPGRI